MLYISLLDYHKIWVIPREVDTTVTNETIGDGIDRTLIPKDSDGNKVQDYLERDSIATVYQIY